MYTVFILNWYYTTKSANESKNISYIGTAEKDMKYIDYLCSYKHNLRSCEIKAWKKKKKHSGLNGIWIHDF